MKEVLNLIELIKTKEISDIFLQIGILKKQIGNQYFFIPNKGYFTGISVLIINNNVKKVMIGLSKEMTLTNIENILNEKAIETYSRYDDIHYYNFSSIHGCKIHFYSREEFNGELYLNKLEITFE